MGSLRKRTKHTFGQKSQPYDTSLKTWVKEDPTHIIPTILPGAVFQEAIDIEAIKPTMRADRVFKVLYNGQLHILDIEFESATDANMRARLHAYNAILYLEYELPVISMIIYPFRTTIAISPLVIESGGKDMLIFHFQTLPLFTLEAENYIEKHLTCMYPLLPAMQGANAKVIAQAMTEMVELYQEDEVSLSQQFIWMELLLERTTTIPEEDKMKIQEGIKMYDPLWEEHPKVKKIKAQAKAEVEQAQAQAKQAQAQAEQAQARAEAQAQARAEAQAQAQAQARQATAKTLYSDLVQIVQARFPELTELAQQTLEQITSPDALSLLLVQVASAPNETIARYILRPSAA
jgi:hypothetical protein